LWLLEGEGLGKSLSGTSLDHLGTVDPLQLGVKNISSVLNNSILINLQKNFLGVASVLVIIENTKSSLSYAQVHKQLVFLICLLLLLAIPLHQQCCPWLILWPFGSLLFVSTLHDQIRLFFVVLIFSFDQILSPPFSFAGCFCSESILRAAKSVCLKRPASWRKHTCSSSWAMPHIEDAIWNTYNKVCWALLYTWSLFIFTLALELQFFDAHHLSGSVYFIMPRSAFWYFSCAWTFREFTVPAILQALRDETMNDPRDRIEIAQTRVYYRPSLLGQNPWRLVLALFLMQFCHSSVDVKLTS